LAAPPTEGASMTGYFAGLSESGRRNLKWFFGTPLLLRWFIASGVVVSGCLVATLILDPSKAGGPQTAQQPVAPTALVLRDAQPDPLSPEAPDATTLSSTVAAEPRPADGLTISGQSWRRGGLGSKALFNFTLRNANDYPVTNIAISCSFARRDGSHLTDRTRTIETPVGTNSRKRFTRLHIGFVNVNAATAKCVPLSASRL